MSTSTVQTIIARAAAEPEFRGLLLSRPAQALTGYDLTADETIALLQMQAERFDAVAGDLEVRESRAINSVNNFSSQLNTAISIVKS